MKMKIIREKERELVPSMACFFLFSFFVPQICVVGGLAIMHTRTLPNLARHQRGKQFTISHIFW